MLSGEIVQPAELAIDKSSHSYLSSVRDDDSFS